MKNFYIILILFLSFTIYSCAKKSDSSSSSSSTTELEGTWVTSCHADGGKYVIKTLTATGTDMVRKWEYHSDSSCANDNDSYAGSATSVSVGRSITYSSGGTGHEFTYVRSTNIYTPQTSAVTSNRNTNSFCGLTNWELNVGQDIAGKTCGDSSYVSSGTTIYCQYLLDGSSVYMSCTTSSSYPGSVPSSNPYIKQ
jgi:hypothetical protein